MSRRVHCQRCHNAIDTYWERHTHEDDLESIKNSGLCMRCAIEIRVPAGWNPDQLGAGGREEFKLKQRATEDAKR